MAATDLLSLVEARSAVNLPAGNTNHDIDLGLYVSGVSGRVDALCGPVVTRAVAGELHNGGRQRVMLLEHYVTSVTSVTEYVVTAPVTLTEETNLVKPSMGFLVERVGPYTWLRRRTAGSTTCFSAGYQNVDVSYVSGRFVDTASVDARFKLAAAAVLRRIWKREQSSWAQTPDFFPDTENPRPSLTFFKAVDPMITELLADQLLPPVGL